MAPRSKSACAQLPSKVSPVRSWTRRTFVSTGSTSRPNAKLPTAAAVYGPMPGSSVRSSGQPRSATSARRAVQMTRAPVVAESLPRDDHVRGRSGGERLDGGPALEPATPARDHAVDLRLLQHHLRDEDRVRVALSSATADRARSPRTKRTAGLSSATARPRASEGRGHRPRSAASASRRRPRGREPTHPRSAGST